MKSLPNHLLFLLKFTLVGLGLAFLWLLSSGQFSQPLNHNSAPNQQPFSPLEVNAGETPSQSPALSPSLAHQNHLGFAKAVEIAQPAVVNVYTRTIINDNQFIRRPTVELGSGVVVDKQGYILTNHHVIEGANEIAIEHSDGRSAAAQVIGTDPDTDLALLYAPFFSDRAELSALDFADSNNLHVGDIVLAIGNQYGIGQTVTQGIVSAKGRRANQSLATYEDFIQTDANISSGNSGGALINTNGDLIGINTAQLSRQGVNSGIGFAIPSNLAKGVFEELKAHGRVKRGWLGIQFGKAGINLTQRLGIENNYAGTMIRFIEPDSPAQQSGLQIFDIILSINDETINNNSEQQAFTLIESLKPGNNVILKVRRNDQVFDMEIGVNEKPRTKN